ncbi:MAG: dihydrolipoamide succinyltransferase [Gammaproteobacteria bacterium]|nr:dihydrolipoamide succinyltransferase [Gammaproteobacteria bacterium]NIX00722.1 dihydrolipoamide succinyltransferase [Phycisphaerae bacterium]
MSNIMDIVMPETEDESSESVMDRWLKQVGDYVEQYEPVLEVSTDKVSMEVAAPASGVLKEILKEANSPLKAGEVLGRIELKEKKPVEQKADKQDKRKRRRRRKREKESDTGAANRLSPTVRRLLHQHDLDASQISGTGRGGRITAVDVENYVQQQERQPAPAPAEPSEIPSHMIPHNPLRRRTAQHMVESMLKTAPHVTAVFDANLSAIVAHREKKKDEFQQRGVKLTYTAYFVDAAAKTLQAVPQVNSRWHEDALEIFEDCNIGIATAVENGLVVPVIHQAQDLNLYGIAKRLQDLTAKARDGKLEKEQVKNGTFTITNHGVSGSLIATPIINQPQSAILGIGKLEKRVVVVEKDGQDTTEIKPMAYVTLTIDHRALDGFQANTFLSKFVVALQEW